jgi:hypothetical protein
MPHLFDAFGGSVNLIGTLQDAPGSSLMVHARRHDLLGVHS